MRIKANRNEHQLRMIALGEREEQTVEDLLIAFVADARWQRHVDCEAGAIAFADLAPVAGAWIMRVLMRRKLQHARGVVEDILRPVPMVHIVIDDEHAF